MLSARIYQLLTTILRSSATYFKKDRSPIWPALMSRTVITTSASIKISRSTFSLMLVKSIFNFKLCHLVGTNHRITSYASSTYFLTFSRIPACIRQPFSLWHVAFRNSGMHCGYIWTMLYWYRMTLTTKRKNSFLLFKTLPLILVLLLTWESRYSNRCNSWSFWAMSFILTAPSSLRSSAFANCIPQLFSFCTSINLIRDLYPLNHLGSS